MKPEEIKKFRPRISNFLAVIGSLWLFGGGFFSILAMQDPQHDFQGLGSAVAGMVSGLFLIGVGEAIVFIAKTNAWAEQIHSANAEIVKALQWIIDNWSERK